MADLLRGSKNIRPSLTPPLAQQTTSPAYHPTSRPYQITNSKVRIVKIRTLPLQQRKAIWISSLITPFWLETIWIQSLSIRLARGASQVPSAKKAFQNNSLQIHFTSEKVWVDQTLPSHQSSYRRSLRIRINMQMEVVRCLKMPRQSLIKIKIRIRIRRVMYLVVNSPYRKLSFLGRLVEIICEKIILIIQTMRRVAEWCSKDPMWCKVWWGVREGLPEETQPLNKEGLT